MGAKKLSECAVLADLTISAWSGSVVDKAVTSEVLINKGAKYDRGKFTKKMFMNLRSLSAITNRMYNEYRNYTVAWEEGRRLLPIEHFETLTKLHRDCSDELEKVLDTDYKENYHKYVEESKKDLGNLYDEAQFPTYDEFKRKWRIKLNFFPIPEKGHFIVQSEKKLVDEMTKSFEEAISSRQILATEETKIRIAETVKGIVERLSGENMKFRFDREVMDSVRQMVDILPSLNLFGDKFIEEMIEELKANLYEVTDRDLHHMGKRKRTLGKAQAILAKMADYAE